VSAHFRTSITVIFLTITSGAGCTGKIGNAGGLGSGAAGNPSGSGGGPSADLAAQYFPGTVAADAPKRLVRLSRTQLDLTAKTVLPKLTIPSAVTAMPSDPLQTNYEYADYLTFNPANFTPFAGWVAAIAASAKAAPDKVIDCAAGGNAPTCLADKAKSFVRSAFRGTLSDAQLTRFADFFTASASAVGIPSATADLVDVTLTSPRFAFRDEVLTDTSGTLQPAEHLQHITYTLADAPPETIGLSSATPNTYVATADATQKTIDQVLASPEARNKLMRFFLAWLEVKEPDQFNIATSAFPEFTPAVAAAVVAETKTFLAQQLGKAAPRMTDLTEATQSIVNSAEAFLYGVTPPSTPTLLDLDPTRRLGIFTQPAVIASHSGPTTTRLVKRGVYFVRKVMCVPLGNPPQGLDTTIPATAGDTERERIETVTAQPTCAGCHAYINPFGFMQENFDAIGRWRTTDNGQPIDASISVDFLDEGPLATSSPVEALRTFTHSMRFQQCFARQLFRFYTGRDEAKGDDPVLRKMLIDFTNGGQDILAMLRALASSQSFSRRAEVP
jgi:Protein of unknown function (DUF1588)/Protein of unknown function (DUF1592)/Protein of unknown function (DUF1585)